MSENDAQAILRFSSRVSAELVQRLLTEANVPNYLADAKLSAGVVAEFELLVPTNQVTRAKFILAQHEDVTDGELTYLATGELGGSSDE